MSKSFRPGLKYVFTKKKFFASFKENRHDYGNIICTKIWVDKCNGREVDVIESGYGLIGRYSIYPSWCKCIGDNND